MKAESGAGRVVGEMVANPTWCSFLIVVAELD